MTDYEEKIAYPLEIEHNRGMTILLDARGRDLLRACDGETLKDVVLKDIKIHESCIGTRSEGYARKQLKWYKEILSFLEKDNVTIPNDIEDEDTSTTEYEPDSNLLKSLYKGDLENFKQLVEKSGGVLSKFANGQRIIDIALPIAIQNGHYNILGYLLEENREETSNE